MDLREILTKLVETNEDVLLSDRTGDWEAAALLERLSAHMLKRSAHIQPGMYIAEINAGGYLGGILYRIKQKT